MAVRLENAAFEWSLHPEEARWKLYPRIGDFPAIEGAGMRVDYRQGRRRFQALKRWSNCRVSDIQFLDSPHGTLQQVHVETGPDRNGLGYTLGFAMPDIAPLFFWWIKVNNQGAIPVNIDRLVMIDASFNKGEIDEPAFYSNGWGSWNYSGTYGGDDRYRGTRLGFFTKPASVNPGTPTPKKAGHFVSDMFGVLGDRQSRVAALMGFISQLNHFGSLEVHLVNPQTSLAMWANGDGARLDPGSEITSDWACIQTMDIDADEPLSPYLDAVKKVAGVRSFTKESRTGWCSWYHFFEDINHEVIQENLESIVSLKDDLPLDFIQIDDGFEKRVGDWFSFKKGFPRGVAPLASEINNAGYTPGLWLAPFILDRKSQLAREHPDWLLRGKMNMPVNAGFIWNRFTTALDLTHPGALEYAANVVNTAVHEWGYPYLKLDFLYAAALKGTYRDPTQTRAQVLRKGLESLREAAGEEATLLGCGCPLGSAIGIMDAMRIGADVAPTWLPEHPLVGPYFHGEPDAPSARNAIQNAITRLPMHNRWWTNDPDCLLVRPETRLSLAEVHSLATVIAMSDGMLVLSDDLSELPYERLQIVKAMLPLIGRPAHVLDWFDRLTPTMLRLDLDGAVGTWSLLALFNWEDSSREAELLLEDFNIDPEDAYIARQFWNGETTLVSDGRLDLGHMPPHGVALVALRRVIPDQPQYLGGDLHISQGLEVRSWEWREESGELEIGLERPGRARGIVEVSLPGQLKDVTLDGYPITWEQVAARRYLFAVSFNRRSTLLIKF